jgi:hypothetical protein
MVQAQAVARAGQERRGLSPEFVESADPERAAVQREERQSLQLSLSVLKLLFAIQQAPR